MKTMYERAKELLSTLGVDVTKVIEHASSYGFYWDGKDEGFDIELYDGGAVSTDGKIVVTFPNYNEVVGDPETFDEFLRADCECREDSEYFDEYRKKPSEMYHPYEAFYICVTGYWSPEQHKIVRDFSEEPEWPRIINSNDFLERVKEYIRDKRERLHNDGFHGPIDFRGWVKISEDDSNALTWDVDANEVTLLNWIKSQADGLDKVHEFEFEVYYNDEDDDTAYPEHEFICFSRKKGLKIITNP